MSWDAYLTDDREHSEGCWNYTHNCNGMIAEALESLGCITAHEVPSDDPIWKLIGAPWWKRLDGCDGATGGKFLGELIGELHRDPAKYKTMNPVNGWGDYDTLLGVLEEMHKACLVEWPTKWSVDG